MNKNENSWISIPWKTMQKDYWINTHGNTNNCHVHGMQTWNGQLVKVVWSEPSDKSSNQLLQAWMHDSDNKLHKSPFTWMKITQKQIHKFQVSGFTNKLFHVSKNNKTPTLCKFPKIHANFPVQNSAISFQSRIITDHLVRSNWIKNTSTGAIPQDIALKSIWTARPTH